MEFKKFAFDPEDGFRDTGFYEDSPSEPREILQRQHDMTRDYINSLTSALSSQKEGESGSEHIGSPKIPGVSGENVFEQLSDMKRQITDYAGGTIPDGTVNENKLADRSVTSVKLAEGSVSDEHFKEGAKINLAVSAEKLNGFAAEDYCPVSLSAVTGGFRERITDEKVVSVAGKTYKGKRYMLQENGTIRIFDIEKESFDGSIDLSEYSRNIKIAFDEEENMYFAYASREDEYGYLNLYKYSDGEAEKLAFLKVRYTSTYTFELFDMEFYNGILYFGFCYMGDIVNLTRLKIAELEAAEDAAPFYNMSLRADDLRIVIKNGNMYCGGKKFCNCDDESVISFCAHVMEDAPGNLLLSSGDFSFVSEENYPEITSVGSFDPAQSFCFGKYLYTMKGGYIFRGKII